jgi:hypothetical protein
MTGTRRGESPSSLVPGISTLATPYVRCSLLFIIANCKTIKFSLLFFKLKSYILVIVFQGVSFSELHPLKTDIIKLDLK